MSETNDTPWRTCRAKDGDAVGITSGDGVVLLAEAYGQKRQERAALIVRARNAHDDLVEALTMVRDADEDCKRDGLPSMPSAARARIDAALAKAEAGNV